MGVRNRAEIGVGMTRTALVTGATGYIGGLLVPRLLADGWRVRVLSRSARKLTDRPWFNDVEVVEGDASNPADLARALHGVEVGYYLVHSMDGAGDFIRRDRELAQGFGAAARGAGVRRLVYLGGLHPEGELSDHLASRVEVGEILLGSGVPTAVLQAGVVLGDGSASFDMLRHLTERLPAMIAPKWLHNRIQPIAVDDVLHYLVAAASLPEGVNQTFDIGGPEVFTYREMMQRYAEVTGLRPRWIRTVPVLTPELAARWVGTVTPVSNGIARPLVGSLVHDAVCRRDSPEFPEPPGGRTPYAEAVRRATATLDPQRWSRTLRRTGAISAGMAVIGGLLTDPDSEWYRSLRKPSWAPPPAAPGIIWPPLYADIALTSARVIAELEERGQADDASAYQRALWVNAALNAGWSGVFFRAKRPWLATAWAAALTASSADLARRAGKAGRGKRLALTPYVGWTGFATVLLAAIAHRNCDPDAAANHRSENANAAAV